MTNMLKPLVIAATFFAAPVFSQDTATNVDGIDLGRPAAPAVANETYVKSTHSDWEVRCIRASETLNNCQMYQQLYDDTGHPTAEITLFNLEQGAAAAAGASVLTPLETLLTPGLSIGVDDTSPRIYQFTFCSAEGCMARVGFTAAEIDQFKRGNEALLRIAQATTPPRRIDIKISLAGFTAAYEETSAENIKLFEARTAE